jgi:hypothetical protein
MVRERILATLTASLSSPMDSCDRDPIYRPSELRFLHPKASFTDDDCGVCERVDCLAALGFVTIIVEETRGRTSVGLSERGNCFCS